MIEAVSTGDGLYDLTVDGVTLYRLTLEQVIEAITTKEDSR